MEHENIFEGDYVVVEELFEGREQPVINEMIVAEYVPLDLKNDESDDEISDDDYMNLTLNITAQGCE